MISSTKNVFLSFQEDDLGVQLRSIIGVDNIMWGSDYPHQEGTFPLSQAILDEVFTGVPLEEREEDDEPECGQALWLRGMSGT